MTGAWKIAVIVPEAAVEPFAAAFEAFAPATAAFEASPGGDWTVEGYTLGMPDAPSLRAAVALAALAAGIAEPELICGPLPERDWVADNQASFKPIRAGRYDVRPTHEAVAPPGSIEVRLDAGPAFGTGAHGSTRGCLLALDGLARRGRPDGMLDLGCGSGILAIAMAKTWRRPVVALDIDADAVSVTAENAMLNGVGRFVRPVLSDGPRHRLVRRNAPFGLIVANILAGPLAAMAPQVAALLKPGGALVLSGLLLSQAAWVTGAYRRRGLVLVRRIVLDEWATLVMERSAHALAGDASHL
ncbi:MAG: 50S ribosomal protein L11 methyltransferase [Alphaproteobacteria bacterium]